MRYFAYSSRITFLTFSGYLWGYCFNIVNSFRMGYNLFQCFFFCFGSNRAITIKTNVSTTDYFCNVKPPS